MSKAPPLITVILPVYNRESFIKEAVESILGQTIRDFELLIIDDGSTDNTLAIVEKMKDLRIKVIKNNSNRGVAASINIGLKEATGKYIARMDSDDISIPNRFEKQLAILENNPEVIVCGSWIKFIGEENYIRNRELHGQILADMLRYCSLSMGTSFFDYSRMGNELLKEDMRFAEDYEFWSRTIWKGKFYNIQEPLLLYRIHENQLTRTHHNSEVGVKIRLSFFKKLNYPIAHFPDNILKKILLLNELITVTEFKVFLKWLSFLLEQNRKKGIFPEEEFEGVLSQIKSDLLQQIFFRRTTIGINRKWRLKALWIISINDVLQIAAGKLREYKRISKF